ncbi:MAG: ABC transporter substrate-binding protein [Cellulosilyticum sp.]|nr:ABC transporter substrate-binding protein [Cellulosilyticum sp.]MEE1072908.1 ABC transporter substrate-binding protein [Cellulosilyticum sp.]
MKKIKLRFILLLVIGLVCMLTGCGQEKMSKITIAEVTHSVFYAPQYVAIEAGFFEEEGINVDLLLTQGADKTMAALLSNEAQIGFMGPESSIYVYNQGSKDYAINFAQVTKRDGTFLVGREPIENFTFDDLKGKELIGGRKGGMPEMTLEYVLKQNGLTLGKNVAKGETFVRTDIQFSAMGGAFIGGEGDFVTLFEPTATQVEASGDGYVIASMGQLSGEIPYTAYSCLASYMEQNPDLVQRFTNAIYKGQQYVANHSAEEIADIIAPQFNEIERSDLVKVVQRYKDNDTWCTDPILKEESLNHLMDVMELAGELNERPAYTEIVNTTFAEQAVK